MAPQDTPSRPLSRPRLLAAVGGSLIAAILIVLGAIIPAEFGRDPLGLGRLSGLARLWAPEEVNIDTRTAAGPRAREYAMGFRSDVIEIPLGGFLEGRQRSELEYKVSMKKDATLIYEWEVLGASRFDDFHYDFHGHTTPANRDERMVVATYRQGFGLKKQGALTAPFDGIQGWQFTNTTEKPIVVRVRLSGFYDLVPPGRPGNEAGIIANIPADKARP